MSDTPRTVSGARIDAERAKARLMATASELHTRLRPDVLLREGVDRLRLRGGEITEEAMEVVTARPALFGGIGAGMLLLWLRRPIARLGRRVFSRGHETEPAADRFRH